MIAGTQEFQQMERRWRATFFNSLAGVRPAVLVGTRGSNGVNNLAVFNSLLHIGADPPRYGLLFRPETVERHTLANLRATRSYSISMVRSEDFRKAHQTSAKYPADVSEFDAVGFTAVFDDGFIAPSIQEAVIRIQMSYEYETEIPMNGNLLVIGRIEKVFVPDQLVSEDGYINHDMAGSLCCSGLDAYFKPDSLGRMPYARPETAAAG